MAFNKTDLYIETLIREFPNKVNWDEISCNKNISVNFIEKYLDKIHKYNILSNKNVQIEHIEKWFLNEFKNDLYEISYNPNLTKDFIQEEYDEDLFSYYYLYKFLELNKNEFCKNYRKITHWKIFFRDFKYMCDLYELIYNKESWGPWLAAKGLWEEIGNNPNITPKFIEDYSSEINWSKIKWNLNMTKEFINKYANKFNWNHFVVDTNIPHKYYVDHINEIKRDNFQYIENLPLKYVFTNHESISNQDIDLNFIDKNIKYIDWYLLSKNTSLSIDVITKYKKKLNWSTIWRNSFENAPDIPVKSNNNNKSDIPVKSNCNNNTAIKQNTAYFVPFKQFNMIETVEDDSTRQLYITDISEETWNFLIRDKHYSVVKTSGGIEIHIGSIVVHCKKIVYNH